MNPRPRSVVRSKVRWRPILGLESVARLVTQQCGQDLVGHVARGILTTILRTPTLSR